MKTMLRVVIMMEVIAAIHFQVLAIAQNVNAFKILQPVRTSNVLGRFNFVTIADHALPQHQEFCLQILDL